MVSGGFRPKGKLDTNVSLIGGNGSKDGQPTRVAAGGEWGSRGESIATQGAAKMKSTGGATARPMAPAPTPLTAYSENPDQAITDGAPVGAGSNTLNLPTQGSNSGFDNSIKMYTPVLNFIASRETTSIETRDAISLLLRGNTSV